MANDQWYMPVILELHGVGQYRTISCNAEAVDCLLDRWPAEEDRSYSDALLVCLAALDGRTTCEMARQALIEAARGAGIYIKPCELNEIAQAATCPP